MGLSDSGLEVGVALAFAAGAFSMVSPCVLALVPAYVTYLSGVSLGEASQASARGRVMLHAVLFVAGFSLLFILFGASASFLGQILLANQVILRRVAGIMVIAFGLHTLGWVRIPFLEAERRVQVRAEGGRPLRALAIGMAFAAGWTPCVGPILGAIMAMAATAADLSRGVFLLAAYSAGLAVPFLLMAAGISRLQSWMPALRRKTRAIQIATGALLIVIGVLVYTNGFARLTGLFGDLPYLL